MPTIRKIYHHRNEHGTKIVKLRKRVPVRGPRALDQLTLSVFRGGDNFDNTAVHPESYGGGGVEQVAAGPSSLLIQIKFCIRSRGCPKAQVYRF